MTALPTLNGQVLGQAERATRAVLDRLLAEADTSFVNWVALNLLAASGPMEAEKLADQLIVSLQMDESEAGAAIEVLEDAALVTTDGTIRLTAGGDTRYRQIRAGIDEITLRLYRDLRHDDLVIARRVLETLTDRAKAELASR